MPSHASPGAKTGVAAVAAVVMAGVTAYQIATRDGFTWWDLIPILAAVFGVACTDHVDNTIGSPAAKAIVHGALSLLAAVTAALAVVVGSEPSGVSLTKLAVAGLGTLAVWAYPELGPEVKVIEGEVASGAPAAQILSTVAGDVSRLMGPDLPTPTAAAAPAAAVEALPPAPVTLPAPAALATTAPLPAADATAPTA